MTAKLFSFFKSSGAAKSAEPPEGQIERARALHQQGQLEAALALYAEVLTAHPDSAAAHYRRANALKDQGALDAAVAGYDQAIALSPITPTRFATVRSFWASSRSYPRLWPATSAPLPSIPPTCWLSTIVACS